MRVAFIAIAIACGLVLGCRGGESKQGVTGDDGKTALEDFGRMLKGLPADNLRPPNNMREFEPMEPATPVGGDALRNKKIVYLWGAGYVPGGTRVVAYETIAETEGGYVLLEDGTVKTMTADELRTAPKAGNK